MSQSKKYTWIETGATIVVGFVGSFALQMLVFPLLGVKADVTQNLKIGAIFTVWAILRGYYMRRGFNWLHQRGWN